MKSRQVYIIFLEFIIACVVKALEYIHNNEIIHMNLKPSNVFFDNNGYIKVSGLGN